MSATPPPAAEFEPTSDFGEFWQPTEPGPSLPSLMPEAEAAREPSLTPEQRARRERLRRAVGGVVLGLLAFTALAACVSVMKARAGAASASAATTAKPIMAAPSQAEPAPPTLAASVSEPATNTRLSEADRALALLQAPVTTVADLQAWSLLVSRLTVEERQRFEHQLSDASVKGPRPLQEAARLELALLWRASARRVKAQKVLLSLARTARDPVVKRYALDTLTSA